MTFLATPDAIRYADSMSLDAFGRLRIAPPVPHFNSKQLWGKDSGWNEATSGSGASAAAVANQASVRLSVSESQAGSITRQTERRFNYQPGKSQLVVMTANVEGLAANVTKRFGYFDDNNGIFFEFTDEAKVVIRSKTSGSPIDTAVAQSAWNVDPMDGTGPSGLTLNFTKIQVWGFDFQWLGAGRIRFFVNIGGVDYIIHEFKAANSLSSVYMSTPNLPLRVQLINGGSGAAATLTHMCSTVITEGGSEFSGGFYTQHTTQDGLNHGADTHNAIFGIRLASDHLDALVSLISWSISASSAGDYGIVRVIKNPTVAGSPTWNTSTFDHVDVFQGTPGTHTVSGGTELLTETFNGQTRAALQVPPPGIVLTHQIDGTADEYWLTINCANAATVAAALNWAVEA